ncbi:MAG: RNA polymerase sigma-70 factor [Bacteroidales bacterium]
MVSRKINELTINRLKLGDEAAFSEVFNIYARRLQRFAYEYIVDIDESDDIVQNCFIKLWEVRETIESESHLEGFLVTTARNFALSHLRKVQVRCNYAQMSKSKALEQEINLMALEDLEVDSLTFKEMQSIVDSSIAALPEECKQVFLLSRQDELTYKEISTKVGVSVRTVERRISQALMLLRRDLKEYTPILLFLFPM